MTPAAVLPANLAITELGIEKRCGRCEEWWPVPTSSEPPDPDDPYNAEFWSFKAPHQLYAWCRGCFAEIAADRRHARKGGLTSAIVRAHHPSVAE